MKHIECLKQNDLSTLLLISIFMNGFEVGGYQAALLYIGQEYALSSGAQGIMASVELFATMVAPLLLGSLADRIGKKIMLVTFTACRVLSGTIILLATSSLTFAVGIFILGFACSIVQYVAIAGMQDAYPVTRHQRMGFITAMYALGAVIAPLIVGAAINNGWGWKSFFILSIIIFIILTVFLQRTSFAPREHVPDPVTSTEDEASSPVYLKGVFLLCLIMFIYVGVENGFCFFLNGFILDTLQSSHGYLALSLFWLAMIPSRILCGIFARCRHRLIIAAPAGAAFFLALLTTISNEYAAFMIIFLLGFFCGAVYPNVLTYAADFAGGRTATVTAAITVATGIGATIVAAAFGFLQMSAGFRGSFLVLAVLLALDILFAILVTRCNRNS